MDQAPLTETPARRFRFDSLTFILGFGFGTFLGVALAIIAFALASDQTTRTDGTAASQAPPTNTANPLVTATPDRRSRTKTQLEVRLGPSDSFAIVGTLTRGEAVSIVGRDLGADWVAIQFPPGSAGRGWVPVDALDTVNDLHAIGVTAATPLARSVPTTPSGSITSSAGAGSDARLFDPEPTATRTTASASSTPSRPGTATPSLEPTSVSGGGSDLAIAGVVRLPDGRVRVTVINRGPDAVAGQTVFITVRDLAVRNEQLIGPPGLIASGGAITLQTSGLVITEEADIQAIVDPSASLHDPNRINNAVSVRLSPPATPEPSPTPGRD